MAAGARVVVTGRDAARLVGAAERLGPEASTHRVDVGDRDGLARLLGSLGEVDHVLLAAGAPHYAELSRLDWAEAEAFVDSRLWATLRVARDLAPPADARASLTLMTTTQARRPGRGLVLSGTLGRSVTALVENLALELAPRRVNAVACGFVDTPLSARLLGDGLDARRDELRRHLPVGRVVGPGDVARSVVHLMTATAITGSVLNVDGGESLLA